MKPLFKMTSSIVFGVTRGRGSENAIFVVTYFLNGPLFKPPNGIFILRNMENYSVQYAVVKQLKLSACRGDSTLSITIDYFQHYSYSGGIHGRSTTKERSKGMII